MWYLGQASYLTSLSISSPSEWDYSGVSIKTNERMHKEHSEQCYTYENSINASSCYFSHCNPTSALGQHHPLGTLRNNSPKSTRHSNHVCCPWAGLHQTPCSPSPPGDCVALVIKETIAPTDWPCPPSCRKENEGALVLGSPAPSACTEALLSSSCYRT